MRSPRSLTILKLLLTTCMALVLIHIVLKYVSVVVYNEQHGFLFELSNRFDMNDESSVPQWFSQALFLGIGALAGAAAYLAESQSVRRLWFFIAVIGVLLSADDVATLHEFVLQSLHNVFFADMASTLLHNTWLVILPFILFGLALLFYWAVRLLPRRTVVFMMTASVIFLFGAVGVDSLANTVPDRSFAGQGVLGAIEGGLQAAGISVFVFTVADYLERHHIATIRRALKSLRQ